MIEGTCGRPCRYSTPPAPFPVTVISHTRQLGHGLRKLGAFGLAPWSILSRTRLSRFLSSKPLVKLKREGQRWRCRVVLTWRRIRVCLAWCGRMLPEETEATPSRPSRSSLTTFPLASPLLGPDRGSLAPAPTVGTCWPFRGNAAISKAGSETVAQSPDACRGPPQPGRAACPMGVPVARTFPDS